MSYIDEEGWNKLTDEEKEELTRRDRAGGLAMALGFVSVPCSHCDGTGVTPRGEK